MADSNASRQRPSLGQMRSNSFLLDHQQYKPPLPISQNIDEVLGAQLDQSLTTLTNPVSPDLERVTDSGVVHSIFHHGANPLPQGTARIVATLFYKSSRPVHPNFHPDASSNVAPGQTLQAPQVPEGSAPTVDMEKIPREPPAPEPEPLDHLYGPYVSQLCLTNFLQTLEQLPTPYQRTNTSHRCLDREDQPRVVEVTFSPPPDPAYLSFADLRKHESIWRFEREWNVEVVLQNESVFRRHKRLAVFDMDSTLIQNEVIDEIAKFIGVEKQVSVGGLYSSWQFLAATNLSGNHCACHERRAGLFRIPEGACWPPEGCPCRRIRQAQVRNHHLSRCPRTLPCIEDPRLQDGCSERRFPASG